MIRDEQATMNISSFVVRCLPDRLDEVLRLAAAIDGLEVHDTDPRGRFVALLEQPSDADLVDAIGRLENIPGVLNASMAYHHTE